VAETSTRRTRAARPAADAAVSNATHPAGPVEPVARVDPAVPTDTAEPVERGATDTAEPVTVEPVAGHVPAAHGHRYRRRTLSQPDGGQLVMTTDGTVLRLGADGSREHEWAPDDPEWPRLAIRFGLHVQSTTISPAGRFVEDTRPPRIGG
jgi:hypothetical protein